MTKSFVNAALEKSMSALWQRQKAIAHNIANEDTPGYKAKRVAFEGLLAKEVGYIERTRSAQSRREALNRLNNIQPVEYELEGLEGRADGNNVDLDSEYIELARVQIQYQALQQRIGSRYTNLKYAITGGR